MSCYKRKKEGYSNARTYPNPIESEEDIPECLILTVDGTTGPKDIILVPIGQYEHRTLYIEGSEQDLQEYQAFMQEQDQHSGGYVRAFE